MATHSGQLFPAMDPNPQSRNTTVNHWMFQKSQIFKSRRRNNTPAINTITPHRLLHFLHPSIGTTSMKSRSPEFKYLAIKNGLGRAVSAKTLQTHKSKTVAKDHEQDVNDV